MKLTQWFLKLLDLNEPAPAPLVPRHLSRRIPRHEFTLVQVVESGVFKVQTTGRAYLLNMTDWKLFGRDLQAFCTRENIRWSSLEKGELRIHCVGLQETLPRGIKYTWRFNKL